MTVSSKGGVSGEWPEVHAVGDDEPWHYSRSTHYSLTSGGAGPYWFSLSIVNVAKLGSVVKVEAQLASGEWVALVRDQNYTSARPQERYGAWVVPQGAGPFARLCIQYPLQLYRRSVFPGEGQIGSQWHSGRHGWILCVHTQVTCFVRGT